MSDEKKELMAEITGDFEKCIDPHVLEDPSELFMFQCSGCRNVHFRHAGYIEVLMPFMRANREKKVSKDSYSVHVCTKCRKCFIWVNERMRDVTNLIDLEAWVKLEQELHKATGPGGQC